MTNNKRAEKIVSYQAANHLSWDKMQDLITSQLDEACEETFDTVSSENYENGYVKGFAAAREKAAGIAEESRRATGLSIMGPSTACAFIAEKIRKMGV